MRPFRRGALAALCAAAQRRLVLSLLAAALLAGPVACGPGPSTYVARVMGQAQTVPLQVVESRRGSVLALVPVFIQGQGPFTFALDTGASQSLIDREIVDRLGLPVVGHTTEVVGVGGVSQATLVRVELWQAGDVRLPATTAITLDLPETSRGTGLRGLLGSDILSDYGAVTVDYAREQLILRSR